MLHIVGESLRVAVANDFHYQDLGENIVMTVIVLKLITSAL